MRYISIKYIAKFVFNFIYYSPNVRLHMRTRFTNKNCVCVCIKFFLEDTNRVDIEDDVEKSTA